MTDLELTTRAFELNKSPFEVEMSCYYLMMTVFELKFKTV